MPQAHGVGGSNPLGGTKKEVDVTLNDALVLSLDSKEGREMLAEAMVPLEFAARRKARREALAKGCVEVLAEVEVENAVVA